MFFFFKNSICIRIHSKGNKLFALFFRLSFYFPIFSFQLFFPCQNICKHILFKIINWNNCKALPFFRIQNEPKCLSFDILFVVKLKFFWFVASLIDLIHVLPTKYREKNKTVQTKNGNASNEQQKYRFKVGEIRKVYFFTSLSLLITITDCIRGGVRGLICISIAFHKNKTETKPFSSSMKCNQMQLVYYIYIYGTIANHSTAERNAVCHFSLCVSFLRLFPHTCSPQQQQ